MPRPRGSDRLWTALRRQFALRLALAGELECPRCGEAVRAGDPWDLDHLTPLSLGGRDEVQNLAPSHRRCNRAAGIRPVVKATREW